MRLHAEEFTINEDLVRRLLAEQLADWVDLPLRPLVTSGTVNALFRLGDDMLVRLPRAPGFADGPIREARWMPAFAPLLPLTVPAHLAHEGPHAVPSGEGYIPEVDPAGANADYWTKRIQAEDSDIPHGGTGSPSTIDDHTRDLPDD